MNGYSLNNFDGFENKWRLVTVRYRRDTKELRFVYANDLAWSGLRAGKGKYADGAIFGKIGFAVKEDASFVSSLAPNVIRRFQFMVRNSQKHASDYGWGYALFDREGKTFPEDMQKQTMGCVACHSIVSNRGYVFAKVVPFFDRAPPKGDAEEEISIPFEEIGAENLPESVRQFLPLGTKRVRSLVGEIRRHLFQGTLDEIRPTLSQEVARHGLPALLLSTDKQRFSLVIAENGKTCTNGQGEKGTSYKGVHNYVNDPKKTFVVNYCN